MWVWYNIIYLPNDESIQGTFSYGTCIHLSSPICLVEVGWWAQFDMYKSNGFEFETIPCFIPSGFFNPSFAFLLNALTFYNFLEILILFQISGQVSSKYHHFFPIIS